LQVLAGRHEIFHDVIQNLLLQGGIAADAQAMRQGHHKPLLHLHCATITQPQLTSYWKGPCGYQCNARAWQQLNRRASSSRHS
jgi:hypothetical protein